MERTPGSGRDTRAWGASTAGLGSPGGGRPTHSYALCELLSNTCPGPRAGAFRAATVSPNSKARGGTKAEKLNPVGSELKNLPQTHPKCFIKLARPCATRHDFLSPLDQWFSTRDNLPPPPPGGHVEVSGDVWLWRLVNRGQDCCPSAMHTAAPHYKESAGPKCL